MLFVGGVFIFVVVVMDYGVRFGVVLWYVY